MLAKRLVALAFVVGAVGAACSSSSSTSTKSLGVNVDGRPSAFNGAFLAYFPNDVKVHAGDTVKFNSIFQGEPHSVTFGKLVDAGVPKAKAAGPDAPDEPAELKKIPTMLPEGPGDAVQSAAAPCFIKAGDPPADAACSPDQMKQPATFDGTYDYFSSGFLPEGSSFDLKLSDKIKPGTYYYFCTLHRAGMSGTVTVVADSAKTPTADQVRQDGDNQLNQMAQKLQPTATALRSGSLPPFIPTAKPGNVLAGGASQDVQEAAINEFGPASLSIPVNGSVTWTVIGPHTITFNPSVSAGQFISKAPDGSVHLNPAAFAPVGSPAPPQPPSGPPPSGPPGPPTLVDAGKWDGAGSHSSGLYLSFPPSLLAYKLTFTKAGSYNYICVLHPGMVGTITVR